MGKLQAPTAIIFDLDDTLIRAYAEAEKAWAQVVDEFAVEFTDWDLPGIVAAIDEKRLWFWDDAERHRLNRGNLTAARRQIVRLAFDDLGGISTSLADAVADRFTRLRDEEMELHSGARETLDELKSLRIRLSIMTNGSSANQRAKIERFGLASWFGYIQIEEEVGVGKPESAAYQHALKKLDSIAAETWIIGDNLEWEVAAPQRLGITSIWFDPQQAGLPDNSAITPDRTIHRLESILTLFDK